MLGSIHKLLFNVGDTHKRCAQNKKPALFGERVLLLAVFIERPQAGTNRRLIADYFGGRRLSSGQPASHCEACRLFFAFSAGLSCGLRQTDLILRDLIYYKNRMSPPINQAAGKTARAAENRRHVYNRSKLAVVYLAVKKTRIFFPGQYSFVAVGVIADLERDNFSFR